MGFLSRLKALAKTKYAAPQPSSSVPPTPDFGGSRTTIPKFTQGGAAAFGALPKRIKRELSLDERRFDNSTIEDLVDILIDAHPDVSYAVWNFLRLGNSGYDISVYKLGNQKRWPQAEKDINELIQRLEIPNGQKFEKSKSFNKVIDQLLLSVVTRGAAACELVVTENIDDVAFIAPVDPATVDFKFENDRFIPYQNQETLSLDIPTFFYDGLDERIDDPYGRSPLLGALNIVLFQLQVLNDIKAVVHSNGYPRLDITIIEEVLLKRVPIQIRNNEVEKSKWLKERMTEIIEMYNTLEPDDVFVHYDSVSISQVGGKGTGGGAMIDVQKLTAAIDNLIMTGLKTLSTLLGRRSSGQTESYAKIEIKLYLTGLQGIQSVVERVMSRALTLYLNIKGKQGIVEFKFKPIEIRTELEQEQFRQIKLLNIQMMYNMGWIDQDEAAFLAVGHAPAAPQPLINQQPTNKDGGTPQGSTDNNPDAGGGTNN